MSRLLKPLTRERLLDFMPKGGTVVEVGVFAGDFSEEIINRVNPERIYLLDRWISGEITSTGVTSTGIELHRKVVDKFSSNPSVTIVRMDEFQATSKFDDASVDWVFLDTIHTKKVVERQLAEWLPKIKIGGFILGHDFDIPRFTTDQAVQEFCLNNRESVRMLCLVDCTFVIEKYA